jgi:6,7-dimethyl-8-ribityllumazine synthase
MPKTFEGETGARGLKVAVLASRYNQAVTSRLLRGALEALVRSGADESDIDVFRVPGAWELPVIAKRLASTRRYDAIVALGCVVRGGTPHFEYVCNETASGLSRVMRDHDVPVGLGVLTCDTLDQAIDRAGGKEGNKGAEAALSAIEMANLLKKVDKA